MVDVTSATASLSLFDIHTVCQIKKVKQRPQNAVYFIFLKYTLYKDYLYYGYINNNT